MFSNYFLALIPLILLSGIDLMSQQNILTTQLELTPKITVYGPQGSYAWVESSERLEGPWITWTNIVVGADGAALVDLRVGVVARFYRATADERPAGPSSFVWIKPGTFLMGTSTSELDRLENELPQHTVILTRGFWMSDHETTLAEFLNVMGWLPFPTNRGDANLPVDNASWNDAVLYCKKLTDRERLAGNINSRQAYRLPTEAEWEYAARAGSTGAAYGKIDEIAWTGDNAPGGKCQVVRQKKPNQWGIYDMIGNVAEFCSDEYVNYGPDLVTDPVGDYLKGDLPVLRGFGNRAAMRRGLYVSTDRGIPGWGFRVVLSDVR
jgi:formylglycine-generating enzyme required for sulfatase activity